MVLKRVGVWSVARIAGVIYAALGLLGGLFFATDFARWRGPGRRDAESRRAVVLSSDLWCRRDHSVSDPLRGDGPGVWCPVRRSLQSLRRDGRRHRARPAIQLNDTRELWGLIPAPFGNLMMAKLEDIDGAEVA